MVSFTLQPLYLWANRTWYTTVSEASWAPEPVLDAVARSLCLCRESNPGGPSRSIVSALAGICRYTPFQSTNRGTDRRRRPLQGHVIPAQETVRIGEQSLVKVNWGRRVLSWLKNMTCSYVLLVRHVKKKADDRSRDLQNMKRQCWCRGVLWSGCSP
jgi:hypothetical protein